MLLSARGSRNSSSQQKPDAETAKVATHIQT